MRRESKAEALQRQDNNGVSDEKNNGGAPVWSFFGNGYSGDGAGGEERNKSEGRQKRKEGDERTDCAGK